MCLENKIALTVIFSDYRIIIVVNDTSLLALFELIQKV